MKYRVYWWIRGVGRDKKQGSDVVESQEELFDIDVEELMEKDIDSHTPKLGGGTGASNVFNWYYTDAEHGYKAKLPNFSAAHTHIVNMNSCGVSNWGVRKIKEMHEGEHQ